jgi:pyruvate dehydrogenase E2 component (dihydrolipoamide acetyltransferase)|tara:strand:- start:6566 stop:7750 length:1185 start_codon:yes stop_codon:yes gene_type:complete
LATPIVMPRLGDFMTEGTVVRIAKSQGETVGQGEVIAEIETEKLNYDLEATEAGLFHPVVEEGANVPVDGLIGYLLAEGETAPDPPKPQSTTAAPSAAGQRQSPRAARPSAGGDVVPSTPGARRLAANLGVDLNQVTPTGPRGRIVEADVRAAVQEQQGPSLPRGLPTPSRSEPLQGMRRSIARHMRDSLTNTAQLSYFLELDVTDAQRIRRDVSKDHDSVITLAHVLTMACAESLKRVPALNTVLVDDAIHYFNEINIGVAVALNDGLIVPVVRNVGEMDVFAISTETHRLAIAARDNKLSPDEVMGGTFTISVLGIVDGFTPIINPPQTGILGIGRTVSKPVVKSGEIVVREMVTVSLTADHQAIDGAVAAAFMRRLQASVERPTALFRHKT